MDAPIQSTLESEAGRSAEAGESNVITAFFEVIFMITITFPDRETEKRALAFLIGRFSGRVLKSGEHLIPEAALEALADQNISFPDVLFAFLCIASKKVGLAPSKVVGNDD
jgi:hypothetical protein